MPSAYSTVLSPDGFAPDMSPPGPPPLPQGTPQPFVSPLYTGGAQVGVQFYYSSAQFQTTVAADLGATLSVNAIAGLPQNYPAKLLLEWGTANQEVAVITSAPSGNGPYTFTGVLRGFDGGGPQVTHSPGAQVNHGVSAADFYQGSVVFNVCDTQFAGGADTTGLVNSSPAIQAAVNAAIANPGGGTVYIPAGSYLMNSTVLAVLPPASTIMIKGDGYQTTVLYYTGPGDCIRMYTTFVPQSYSGLNNPAEVLGLGSGVTNLMISGLYASPGSCGLHFGDIQAGKLDLYVRDFAAAGCIGLHLDNSVNWTEQSDFRAQLFNNASNVVFEVTSVGTSSFGYSSYDFSIIAQGNQDGVVLKNGAQVYHSNFRLRGDFSGSAAPTSSAVLRLTGTALAPSVNAGSTSQIFRSHVQVLVENTFSSTYNPYSIYIDANCSISGCYGILDFFGGGNSFQPCNITVATNPNPYQFLGFMGQISDPNLNPGGNSTWAGPVVYTQAACINYSGVGTTDALAGDVFAMTLTQSMSMDVAYSGGSLAAPQRKTFYLTQAASGGPYAVTWPVNGSATPSAPNVAWPGGVAPVMTSTAGATDVFMLETLDGAHWFGHVIQTQGGLDAFNVVLGTAFTSVSGSGTQNVTGMAVVLPAGKWELEAWVPMTPSGTTGSTQTLAFTFGGTTTSASSSWQIVGSAGTTGGSAATLTTASPASPVMTSTGLIGRWNGHAVVSVSGTLQLTILYGTSGDQATIPVGAYIRATPVAT